MILAIYGCGGLGKEIHDLAIRINLKNKYWSKIFFIDDINEIKKNGDTDVYKFDEIKKIDNIEFIIAVGEPFLREKLYKKIIENNKKFSTLIDPTAIISPNASIDEGVIIGAFCSVHANAKLGKNCLIQPYSLIGHDVNIGEHSVISTHFCPGGGCKIGNRVYIGMHACVKENVKIGNDSIIGMGACVFNDIKENMIALGNPARPMKTNIEHKVFKK